MKRNRRPQTVELNRDDYEFFNLSVPLKVLLSGKKKQFLYGELGKIYPCFSEASCFDYKLVLGMKGFSANVVVMEKFLLAEYFQKIKNHKLWFPELKKNCFESSNSKNRKLLVISLFVLLAVFLFCGAIFRKSHITENAASAVEAVDITESKKYLGEDFLSLLEAIKNCDGKIQKLNWQCEGFKEIFSASLLKVFPEDFEVLELPVEVSKFSFAEGIPFCEMKNTSKVSLLPQENEFVEAESWKSHVREELNNCGSTLLSENLKPYEITFITSYEKFNEVMKNLNWLLKNETNRCVNYLEIIRAKKGLQVNIKTGSFSGNRDVLAYAGNYAELFSAEADYEKRSDEMKDENSGINTQPEIRIIKSEPDMNWDNMKKIGEIVHEGGNTVVFYKNKEGRIFTREKESVK